MNEFTIVRAGTDTRNGNVVVPGLPSDELFHKNVLSAIYKQFSCKSIYGYVLFIPGEIEWEIKMLALSRSLRDYYKHRNDTWRDQCLFCKEIKSNKGMMVYSHYCKYCPWIVFEGQTCISWYNILHERTLCFKNIAGARAYRSRDFIRERMPMLTKWIRRAEQRVYRLKKKGRGR